MHGAKCKPTQGCDVSVLMPVYNASQFLVHSIASIVEQSFPNWELICIDDGSSDGSSQILEKFARIDPRIRVFRQVNNGIVSALQSAIRESRGELLARMDADDIAVPSRLQTQVDFMRKNADVVVVGGAALEIDADGDPLRVTRHPCDSDAICERLLRRQCPLIHPSVMMRRSAVLQVGGYREQYQWVEDYDLWLRLLHRGRLANLDTVVLYYRQHAASVCWTRSNKQRELINMLLNDAYAMRNRPCPTDVLVHESKRRAHAGPGKWLRLALQGGYTRTAWKHWRDLLRSDQTLLYKCRMTIESLMRYPVALARKQSASGQHLLPDLAEWNSRIARV